VPARQQVPANYLQWSAGCPAQIAVNYTPVLQWQHGEENWCAVVQAMLAVMVRSGGPTCCHLQTQCPCQTHSQLLQHFSNPAAVTNLVTLASLQQQCSSQTILLPWTGTTCTGHGTRCGCRSTNTGVACSMCCSAVLFRCMGTALQRRQAVDLHACWCHSTPYCTEACMLCVLSLLLPLITHCIPVYVLFCLHLMLPGVSARMG
jgi:hypothetical protein